MKQYLNIFSNTLYSKTKHKPRIGIFCSRGFGIFSSNKKCPTTSWIKINIPYPGKYMTLQPLKTQILSWMYLTNMLWTCWHIWKPSNYGENKKRSCQSNSYKRYKDCQVDFRIFLKQKMKLYFQELIFKNFLKCLAGNNDIRHQSSQQATSNATNQVI